MLSCNHYHHPRILLWYYHQSATNQLWATPVLKHWSPGEGPKLVTGTVGLDLAKKGPSPKRYYGLFFLKTIDWSIRKSYWFDLLLFYNPRVGSQSLVSCMHDLSLKIAQKFIHFQQSQKPFINLCKPKFFFSCAVQISNFVALKLKQSKEWF